MTKSKSKLKLQRKSQNIIKKKTWSYIKKATHKLKKIINYEDNGAEGQNQNNQNVR